MYTRLKKLCRVKSINDGQCATMELWEDGRGKFVTGSRFVIFKIFSFQGNLNSKLRHEIINKNRGKISRFPEHHWVASLMIYAYYWTTFFNWVYMKCLLIFMTTDL